MQIEELLKLTKWFEKYIKEVQIPQKLQQLHKVMNQNVSARQNQQKQPFSQQKDNLITELSNVNFSSLSIEQIKLLKKLEIFNLFSKKGVSLIEEILYKNQLDIATATIQIAEISTKIQNSVQRFDQFKASFLGLYSIETPEEIDDGNIFMRIYFQGDSSIKSVTELKKLGAKWYDIGRGVAMVNNCSPEDFKIVGAQKGSVILELTIIAAIATTMSTILLAGLKVAEKSLDILKKAEELKALKLGNQKIITDLKKEAAREKKEGVERIVQSTIEQIGINPEEEGDKVTALEKAVKNIVEFTENGGNIDFIQPPDDDIQNGVAEENGIVEFRRNCKEIRIIEKRIKYIEYNNDDDN